ncbi:unnamed protein product, partial [Closterium sp. Naga37s-1]
MANTQATTSSHVFALLQELGNRVAPSAATTATAVTATAATAGATQAGDGEEAAVVERRFREVLPTLVHKHLVPRLVRDREVLAILKLLMHIARNYPGTFLHGHAPTTLPFIARALVLLGEAPLRSRVACIVDVVWSLAALMRSTDETAFAYLVSDVRTLIQDTAAVAMQLGNKQAHGSPSKERGSLPPAPLHALRVSFHYAASLPHALRNQQQQQQHAPSASLLSDLPPEWEPGDEQGRGVLLHVAAEDRWQAAAEFGALFLSRLARDQGAGDTTRNNTSSSSTSSSSTGSIGSSKQLVRLVVTADCYSALGAFLCFGSAQLHKVCFSALRDLISTTGAPPLCADELLLSLLTILATSSSHPRLPAFRTGCYDQSLAECLHALASAATHGTLRVCASLLLSLFPHALLHTSCLHLQVALLTCLRRTIPLLPPSPPPCSSALTAPADSSSPHSQRLLLSLLPLLASPPPVTTPLAACLSLLLRRHPVFQHKATLRGPRPATEDAPIGEQSRGTEGRGVVGDEERGAGESAVKGKRKRGASSAMGRRGAEEEAGGEDGEGQEAGGKQARGSAKKRRSGKSAVSRRRGSGGGGTSVGGLAEEAEEIAGDEGVNPATADGGVAGHVEQAAAARAAEASGGLGGSERRGVSFHGLLVHEEEMTWQVQQLSAPAACGWGERHLLVAVVERIREAWPPESALELLDRPYPCSAAAGGAKGNNPQSVHMEGSALADMSADAWADVEARLRGVASLLITAAPPAACSAGQAGGEMRRWHVAQLLVDSAARILAIPCHISCALEGQAAAVGPLRVRALLPSARLLLTHACCGDQGGSGSGAGRFITNLCEVALLPWSLGNQHSAHNNSVQGVQAPVGALELSKLNALRVSEAVLSWLVERLQSQVTRGAEGEEKSEKGDEGEQSGRSAVKQGQAAEDVVVGAWATDVVGTVSKMLQGAMQDEHAGVRRAAVELLALLLWAVKGLSHHASVRPHTTAAETGRAEAGAASACGGWGQEWVVPLLRKLAADSSEEVQVACARALGPLLCALSLSPLPPLPHHRTPASAHTPLPLCPVCSHFLHPHTRMTPTNAGSPLPSSPAPHNTMNPAAQQEAHEASMPPCTAAQSGLSIPPRDLSAIIPCFARNDSPSSVKAAFAVSLPSLLLHASTVHLLALKPTLLASLNALSSHPHCSVRWAFRPAIRCFFLPAVVMPLAGNVSAAAGNKGGGEGGGAERVEGDWSEEERQDAALRLLKKFKGRLQSGDDDVRRKEAVMGRCRGDCGMCTHTPVPTIHRIHLLVPITFLPLSALSLCSPPLSPSRAPLSPSCAHVAPGLVEQLDAAHLSLQAAAVATLRSSCHRLTHPHHHTRAPNTGAASVPSPLPCTAGAAEGAAGTGPAGGGSAMGESSEGSVWAVVQRIQEDCFDYLASRLVTRPALVHAFARDVLGWDVEQLITRMLPVVLPSKVLEAAVEEAGGGSPQQTHGDATDAKALAVLQAIAQAEGTELALLLMMWAHKILARLLLCTDSQSLLLLLHFYEAHTGLSPQDVFAGITGPLLEEMCWFLGDHSSELALKRASRVFPTIRELVALTTGSEATEDRAADFLCAHLMRILNALHRSSLRLRSDPPRQEQALRVIGQLAKLAGPKRLAAFAPKMFALLAVGVEQGQAESVRSTGLDVWLRFVHTLAEYAPGVLRSMCSQIAVALLPCLEGPEGALEDEWAGLSEKEVKELAMTQRAVRAAQGEEMLRPHLQKAAAVFSALVIEHGAILGSHLRALPLLPDLGALRHVNGVIQEARGRLGVREKVVLTVAGLGHESISVRLVAADGMKRLLQEHGGAVSAMLVSEREADREAECAAVAALLAGSAEESKTVTSHLLKLACAECLGELGAVDPARLSTSAGVKAAMLQAHTGSQQAQQQQGVGQGCGSACALMVACDDEELAADLISLHLARVVRAATDADVQDAAACAIQEMLRVFGCRRSREEEEVDEEERRAEADTAEAAAEGQEGGGKGKGRWSERGVRLWERLRGEVREVISPCLTSHFSLQRLPTRSSATKQELQQGGPAASGVGGAGDFLRAVFRPGALFRRWLYRWMRRMVEQAAGFRGGIFAACTGILQFDAPTALFLLPHLTLNVLCFGSDEARGEVRDEILAVVTWALTPGGGKGQGAGPAAGSAVAAGNRVTSASRTDGGAASKGDAMVLQAVFSLLDWVQSWLEQASSVVEQVKMAVVSGRPPPSDVLSSPLLAFLALLSPSPPPAAATAATAPARTAKFVCSAAQVRHAEEVCGRVRWVVEREVSKEVLAHAALRCQAYSRAYMYHEASVRERSGTLNPAAAGGGAKPTLPSLAGSEAGPGRVDNGGAVTGDGADARESGRGNGGGGGGSREEQRQGGAFRDADVSLLLEIYRSLEEPDGMRGLVSLRGAAGAGEASGVRARDEMVMCEQEGRWADALTLYEDALGGAAAGGVAMAGGAVAGACTGDSGVQVMRRRVEVQQLPPGGVGEGKLCDERATEYPCEEKAVEQQQASMRVGLHVGLLGCLLSMGHLHATLTHVDGLLLRFPLAAPTWAATGVQAAWRLGAWDLLHEYVAAAQQDAHPVPQHDEQAMSDGLGAARVGGAGWQEEFQLGLARVGLARVGLAMRSAAWAQCREEVVRTRACVLPALAAAAMESYDRAYPVLVNLHALHEIEACIPVISACSAAAAGGGGQGVSGALLGSGGARLGRLQGGGGRSGALGLIGDAAAAVAPGRGVDNSIQEFKAQVQERLQAWPSRLHATQPSFKVRELVLAVRRMLCQAARLEDEVGRNWLELARTCRKAGHCQAATRSVLQARALGTAGSEVEAAKVLWASGREYQATQELQKFLTVAEAACTGDNNAGQDAAGGVGRGGSGGGAEGARDTWQMARALLLLARWSHETRQKQTADVVHVYERAAQLQPQWEKPFFLARYFDDLLVDAQRRQEDDGGTAAAAVGGGGAGGGKGRAGNGAGGGRGVSSAGTGGVGGSRGAAVRLGVEESAWWQHVHEALLCYSNALHRGTLFLSQALPRVLTLWFDFGGRFQESAVRGNAALKAESARVHKLMADCIASLPSAHWLAALPQLTSRICHPNPTVCALLKALLVRLLTAHPHPTLWTLIAVCKSAVPARRDAANEVVSGAKAAAREEGGAAGTSLLALISQFTSFADAMIRLCFHGSTGSSAPRMRALSISSDFSALKRSMPLAVALPTQAVLAAPYAAASSSGGSSGGGEGECVTICGIADEVEVLQSLQRPKKVVLVGSDGMRYPFLCKPKDDLRKDARMMDVATLLNRLLHRAPEGRRRALRLRTFAVLPLTEDCGMVEWVPHTRGFRHVMQDLYAAHGLFDRQKTLGQVKRLYDQRASTGQSEADLLRRHVLPLFPPLFHRWFPRAFPDPSAWLAACAAFTRSCAVWSMVGHVVGLGDRHGENLLVDGASGECVHVDFSCLFDKGLSLQQPELVPFRLTQNMVDGFGISGCEGMFRRSAEITLALLRCHRSALMSVLQTFLHDPLVEWTKPHRSSSSSAAAAAAAAAAAGGGGVAMGTGEIQNPYAQKALSNIDSRLQGVVVGVAAAPSLPLSVEGQADCLIQQATSIENLARMYIWWMP